MHATKVRPLRTTGIVLATALAVVLAVTLSSLAATTLEGSSAARARSAISTTWSASTVTLGTPATVRGRVTSRHLQRRSVSLYVYLKSGWRRAAWTTSDRLGRYQLRVPTGYYLSRPMQVRSRATSRARAVVSANRTFTVTPPYLPAGSRSAWAPVVAGQETRVNPCRTVTYRVNVASATAPGALADIQATFARVHEATGIGFRYLGTTTAVPRPSSLSTTPWPVDSTLVVAFVNPDQTTYELGGPAGYEVFSQSEVLATQPAQDAQGAVRRITRGAVVVDASQDLGSGFEKMRGRILMHEVAGALGLGSVTDAAQRMSLVIPEILPPKGSVWGAGDLTGLNRVGLVEGCVTDNR